MSAKVVSKSKDRVKSEHTRAEFFNEAKAARRGTNGIDKKSVTYHKATGGSDATKFQSQDGTEVDVASAVMRPNEEQLGRINKYTRSPKTADQLVAFTTLSANTLPDRDDDYFDKETILGFSELPEPYGPTGKSYMVGHDYNTLPQGRIFGTGTADTLGTTFLTNEVYIPNTQKNQGFIEDIDFGVNWAVSVGVLLDAQLCSICAEPQHSFWGVAFCETGHWKGELYDPAEDRTDDWGDIIPARENDPKAVKCLGVMHGAKDFYELSQVFLGAQFHAALDTPSGSKTASLKRAKSALKGGVFLSPGIPILGLSADEAEALPLPHADPKVADAILHFDVERGDDGSLKWVDGEGLVWSYQPGDSVKCLGKSAEAIEQEDADGEGTPDESLAAAEGQAGGAGEGGGGSELEEPEHRGAGDDSVGEADSGSDDQHADEVGSDGDLTEDPDDEDDTSDQEDDESDGDDNNQKGVNSAMSKAAVLSAARRAKCPSAILSAINDAADDKALEAALRSASSSLSDLSTQVEELTPKAALGEQYLKSKRAAAIDAFVKSHAGHQEGVSTKNFERMLDSFGGDVDLIEEITAQYKSVLRGKLPAPGVRRSSEPTDPNERQGPKHGTPMIERPTTRSRQTVSRIHG